MYKEVIINLLSDEVRILYEITEELRRLDRHEEAKECEYIATGMGTAVYIMQTGESAFFHKTRQILKALKEE